MEGRLLVLHRVIEALDPGLLPAVGDTDEQLAFKHRRVQDVVYLVQTVAGIDLAYHYQWRDGEATDDGLRRAFENRVLQRLKKVTEEIKSIQTLLKARSTSGLGKPLDGREARMTEGAVTNLTEADWRVQGAFDRLNSLLTKGADKE